MWMAYLAVTGGIALLALKFLGPLDTSKARGLSAFSLSAATSRTRDSFWERNLRLLLTFAISIIVALPALYVLCFAVGATQAQQQWASAAMGGIIGYWINGAGEISQRTQTPQKD